MKILRQLRFGLIGEAAGLLATLGLAWLWPTILPAVVRVEHYYGVGPSLPQLVFMTAVVIAVPAFLGGWLGSRIPREGGFTEQAIMAALAGVVFTVPFACYSLWLWTGY